MLKPKFSTRLVGCCLLGLLFCSSIVLPANAGLEPLSETELAKIWAKSSEVDQPPSIPKEQVKRRQSVSSQVVETVLRNMNKDDVVRITLNKKMLNFARKGAAVAVKFANILGGN